MAIKIGTVFNFQQLPNVTKFPFVINRRNNGILTQKGLFVYTTSHDGFLIGIIEEIILINEYFTDALTIKAYNNNNNPNTLKGLFPSEEFEFSIGIVKCLGLIKFKDKENQEIERVQRMTYPASPGKEVSIVGEALLNKFLGFNNKSGLHLGNIKILNSEVKIDMNRLLNKHFAILSISGGGKSYFTSVLIEELLTRKEVNEITQTFFQLLLESDTNIRKTSKEIIESGEWNKVYYIKGKRVSEDRFNQEKDHPRKFYGYGKGERS